MSWVRNAGVGFVRACVVAVVTMLVPAVWAAAMALGELVGGGQPVVVDPAVRGGRRRHARPVPPDLPDGPLPRREVDGHRHPRRIPGGRAGDADVHGLLVERLRRTRGPAATPSGSGVAASGGGTRPTGATCGSRRSRRSPRASSRSLPPAGVAVAVLGLCPAAAACSGLSGRLGLVVAIASAPYAWRPSRRSPSASCARQPSMALADRVDELTAQRADTTVAQAAEIRRIERDLHDGAQARLVALGLSLATAEKLMETDPDQAKALMREARVGAATSLTELRELVRGINPPVLNERGLVDAVRALALDSPLEAAVSADVRAPPGPADRVGPVLRHRRTADQRGQARPCDPGTDLHRPGRHRASSSMSRTTAAAEPACEPAADLRGCAAASRSSTAPWRSPARPAVRPGRG